MNPLWGLKLLRCCVIEFFGAVPKSMNPLWGLKLIVLYSAISRGLRSQKHESSLGIETASGAMKADHQWFPKA